MSDNTPNPLRPSNAFTAIGTLLLCAWALAALSSYKTQIWLDTQNAAALCILALLVVIISGGPKRLSQNARGRLLLAGLFAGAAIALSPSFHVASAAQKISELDNWTRAGAILPVVACAGIWALSFFTKKNATKLGEDDAASQNVPERLEAFLASFGNRFRILILVLLMVPAVIALSNLPGSSMLIPLLFFVFLALGVKALLELAGTPMGARALAFGPLLACGFAAVMGYMDYCSLTADVALAQQKLAADKWDESKVVYDRAVATSQRLKAVGPRIELDTSVARWFESKNSPAWAGKHWEKVAELQKISGEKFPPLQRVQCAQGDSRNAWRWLVFDGFSAVDTPELVPGIQRCGEIAGDVRGKLLAGLLSWERQEPESVRRKLFEGVQAISPGEPTSYLLLQRLGATPPPLKEGFMWLPAELFIGRRGTQYVSLDGSIEDLGEMGSMVYLEEGHWELSLRASATPLHEEWPVVRVELNGQVLGPTQVNKAEPHDVPFVFDVKRRDLFSLRIVFQNHQEDLEGGRIARRGLTIYGIKLSRAKE